MARVREFSLEDLGIPNLAVKRHKLANGTIRCYVIETKTVWDHANKRAKPAYTKSVGVVENNSEFGRIIFKEEFLERYPQLREVTVLRKENYKYVYRKGSIQPSVDQAPGTTAPVGYLKPGLKRYAPQADHQAQAPDACEYYIGLMSGTSIDSMDGVLVALTPDEHSVGGVSLKTIATTSLDWAHSGRHLLNDLCQPGHAQNNVVAVATARQVVAAQSSLVVAELLHQAQLSATDITAIGSHGQTVWHAPTASAQQPQHLTACLPAPDQLSQAQQEQFKNLHLGMSLQIDNGPLLAGSTGIDVISDLRSADLAQGGQGAPLTQAFHHMIFGDPHKVRMVLNLGGIANLTVLDHGQLQAAYDTGPANTLIDLCCQTYAAQNFDRDGLLARVGKVNAKQLKLLLSDPYFAQPAPKSTGRELFNAHYLKTKLGLKLTADEFAPQESDEALSPAVTNLIATLTEFTARTVSDQIVAQVRQLTAPPDPIELIVCGGGAFNTYLMERIQALGQKSGLKLTLRNASDLGVDAKFIEAQAFAYFAYCMVHAQPLNLGQSTGALHPSILGSLSPALNGHYARTQRF